MNVFAVMLERVLAAADALAAGLDRTRVTVEPPRDPAHGDMTTNAALVLAREAGRPPRELADALAVRLRADAFVERAEVAGPGFVNITLRPDVWTQVLRAVLGATAVTGAARREEVLDRKDLLKIKGFYGISNLTNEEDRDAVRFMMLLRAHGSARDVDLVSAREQSYDNPVFCVQYGHARARSVFRRAGDAFPDLPADPVGGATLLRDAPLELLTDAGERVLMRRIAQYPHIVETAAMVRERQRIALYLHELASAFHTHSRHGNATPHLRFIIQNDRQLTVARLALVEAVVIILAAGLALLGVGAPDEMR